MNKKREGKDREEIKKIEKIGEKMKKERGRNVKEKEIIEKNRGEKMNRTRLGDEITIIRKKEEKIWKKEEEEGKKW